MIAERILNGDFITEHMIGGMGQRLGLKLMSKFQMLPKQFAEKYTWSFPEESEQSAVDVLGNLAAPYSLGIRHMLAYTHSIAKLAEEFGVDPGKAMKNQTVFIITNPGIDEDVRQTFALWDYFGLDKDKVFFMTSESYQGICLSQTGQFGTTVAGITHNHGTARFQTTMDDAWSPVHRANARISAAEVRAIYAKAANLQSLNIEDVSYLTGALDLYAMMISSGIVAEEYKGFGMAMDVVGQNPKKAQKGGILALDPDFDGNGQRLTMVEAFTGYPEYYHWDDAEAQQLDLYTKFDWLNLNNNNFPNPLRMFDHLRTYGIPVYPEVKEIEKTGEKVIRNECPQGELAHFLPTVFVARTKKFSGLDKPRPLQLYSVKVMEHVPLAMSAFLKQDNLPGFLDFARQFDPDAK